MTASIHRPWTCAWWRTTLLTFELGGAGLILWWGVPFYRELLDGNFSRSAPFVKCGVVLAITVIQSCYWLRYTHPPALALPQRVIRGHLSLFLSRLNFIFAAGVFSAVFFVRYDQVIFSWSGAGLLFGILFSMFCVTRDLERIGSALLSDETSPAPGSR